MGAMTRLDAVNTCLLAAGEAIVSDLDNQSGVDTTIAEYLLDQYTRDFQFRGLANNEYVTKLTVDANGRIPLPSTVISLDFKTLLANSDGEYIRVSIKKDGSAFYLWNVTNQTYDFSEYSGEDIRACLIVSIDWENIDTPGQRAITAQASRRYQMLTQGDEGMDQYLAAEEAWFNTKGVSRDIHSKGRTIWDASSYQEKRSVFRPSYNVTNPNFRYWRGRTS